MKQASLTGAWSGSRDPFWNSTDTSAIAELLVVVCCSVTDAANSIAATGKESGRSLLALLGVSFH